MPKAQMSFYGPLGAADSALELKFRADDLLDWDDFINILRGKDAEPVRIGGKVDWRGRILGPLVGPTFVGHLQAANARYDTLYWDAINGDIEYSPDDFRLTHATVQRGRTLCDDGSRASARRRLEFPAVEHVVSRSPPRSRADRRSAALFGTNYPISGTADAVISAAAALVRRRCSTAISCLRTSKQRASISTA